MDRLSPLDASFYYAESPNTPMHVGSVSAFEGPATPYSDTIRLVVRGEPYQDSKGSDIGIEDLIVFRP